MHVETFSSTEEMIAALRERAQHALAGLHPTQGSLTHGSHWVRFVDLDNRVIEFGRVSLREEVAAAELEAGATVEEMAMTLEDVCLGIENGYLYGRAHSRHNVEGELGTTHKAHVWAIEERLFDMAKAVDFKIEDLDEAGRVLLNLAFQQMKAHVIGSQS